MIFVDTDIWIYYFDQRLPEHGKVVDALEPEIKSEVLSSTTVLMEMAHFFRGLQKEDFWERLEYLKNLETMEIVEFDMEMLELALQFLAEYSNKGIGARDSTILAAMRISNVSTIMTHDKAFEKVPWVEVMDLAA